MDVSLATIVLWAVPVVFAITLHEAAHGYVAKLFGDQTAWMLGRVTRTRSSTSTRSEAVRAERDRRRCQRRDRRAAEAEDAMGDFPRGVTGRCSHAGGAGVLQLRPVTNSAAHPLPDATWGLHLVDANVALGNLTNLVRHQIRSTSGVRIRLGSRPHSFVYGVETRLDV